MLVLGILLLLLAAALLLAALFGGRPADEPAGFDLGAIHVDANTFAVFLMGAATLVVAVVGLWLIMAGLRRANRRRQDKKELSRLSRKLEAREAPSPAETAPAGATQSSGGSPTAAATPAPAGSTPTSAGSTTSSAGSAPTNDAVGDRPTTERDQPKP